MGLSHDESLSLREDIHNLSLRLVEDVHKTKTKDCQ